MAWVGKRMRREHDADEGLEGEVGYSEDVEAVVGLDGQGGPDDSKNEWPHGMPDVTTSSTDSSAFLRTCSETPSA